MRYVKYVIGKEDDHDAREYCLYIDWPMWAWLLIGLAAGLVTGLIRKVLQ